MYTYEMVKLADEDGKTYTCGNYRNSFKYSKEKGFYADDYPDCGNTTFVKGGLSEFVHIDKWYELKTREMSLEEAIKHCEEKAKELSCSECAKQHLQLAIWLKELLDYKYNELK